MTNTTNNEIILYTTGCPKCKVLEKLLKQRDIAYSTESRAEQLEAEGFKSVPMVKVNNIIMDFGEAFRWAAKFGLK